MFLLFDIGGTNTRLAISKDGKSLETTQIIPTHQDMEEQIQSMSEAVENLRNDNSFEAVIGGVAGALSKDKSVLIGSPNLPKFIQRPLKEELEAVFDAPVYLENDAKLGGLGEACFGVGKDYKSIAFITIGTGLGGVKIVDKKIDQDSLNYEPGHQIIQIDGDICNCGGKGHLEAYIAGSYLKKLYGIGAENIKDEQTWNEIAKYLAAGLNNTIVHWSPEVIILSGSVMQRLPIELVKSHLHNYLKILPSPEIIKGILGHEAGLYGGLNFAQSIASE